MKYIIFMAFMLAPAAKANEWKLLELQKVDIEAEYIAFMHDPYMPQYTTNTDGEQWAYGAGLAFDLDIVSYGRAKIFWRNYVPMRATDRQVRYVGWNWELGLPLYFNKGLDKEPDLELFYRHFSEHVLEDTPPQYMDQDLNRGRGYPIVDSYVLRFNLYRIGE